MKKITIRLTAAQKKKLAPFFDKVMEVAAEAERVEDPSLRLAILGQVWGDCEEGRVPEDVKAGTANFYLLTGAQRAIINVAIVKAKKLKGVK